MLLTLAEPPPPTVRPLNIPDGAAGVRRKLKLMQLARKGKLRLDIPRAFLDAIAESIAHPALATIEQGGALAFPRSLSLRERAAFILSFHTSRRAPLVPASLRSRLAAPKGRRYGPRRRP